MNQKELDAYIRVIIADFAAMSKNEFKRAHRELYSTAYDKIDVSVRKAILSSIPTIGADSHKNSK